MDAQQRLDRIARHLAELFSGGMNSISIEDEIDDGVLLAKEIDAVLRTRLAHSAKGDLANVIEAFATIDGVWQSGFELASGDDLVTDDNDTVSDIVCDYADRLGTAPVVA